ncbi:MAG: 4-carboxymuconolactone decarboxylase [Pseudoalteromonas tetraodonis]|jgi:4-carboxymuconolactone decarboxylase
MSTQYDDGLAIRRKVMGDDFVDKALNNASDFTQPAQELITRNAWGEVWTDKTLDLKTRSLITIGILASLKASNELKGHVRGAIHNGATVEEIQAVLKHVTVYCGAPAGLEAFRSANEVIEILTNEAP